MDTLNHPHRHRKIVRLPDYDYSQNGAYFITVVTKNRLCLFGNVLNGEMVLNDAGMMVSKTIDNHPKYIADIEISHYQIMPNHIHAVILLNHDSGRPRWAAPTENDISLMDIVGRFKSLTTRRYIEDMREFGWPPFSKNLWQRSFYEHVIRNEREHQAIVDYIYANPMNWAKDKENQS